jgi:hypothetical protein
MYNALYLQKVVTPQKVMTPQKVVTPQKVRTPATLLFYISKNYWPQQNFERLPHCCFTFPKTVGPNKISNACHMVVSHFQKLLTPNKVSNACHIVVLHFQKLLVPTKVRTPATLLFCISKNC